MSSVSWIVTTTPQVSGLVGMAKDAGLPVEAVVVGERATAEAVAASGVDTVRWVELGDSTPAEAASTLVADLAESEQPRLVLGGTSSEVKALLGAVAARTGAELLPAVASVEAEDAGLRITRALFGGIAESNEVWSSPVVALADAGSAVQPSGEAAQITAVEGETLPITGVERAVAPQEHVDLGAAKRIVAVGRGVKAREDLALAQELADALGAEVACSRPLAEGVDWFAKDRYVGVSGAHVAPELYIALGISGQLQHMSGMKGAHTVVAVNTDKDAPVFTQSDFGVVGDLYQVVPALTAALKG
ncbi:MAG: electron transfer flavoprotein subunit alpha/FixB family protein [Actinomyces sp.]|nr:electron transfer flavoprotein subunit alpha/FixB family protein [Actinomyces sp.]